MRSNDSTVGRRTALRATGATVVGALVSMAGCLAGLPPLGQRVRFGRADVPAADLPEY